MKKTLHKASGFDSDSKASTSVSPAPSATSTFFTSSGQSSSVIKQVGLEESEISNQVDDTKKPEVDKISNISQIEPKAVAPLSLEASSRAKIETIKSRIKVKSPTKDGPAINLLQEKGYILVEKLGAGNYANVYRIKTRSNKEMAVKIIQLDNVSKNYKVRFLPRELEIIAKLSHKNIVQIYAIQTSHNYIFIFMELVSYGTLGDFIRKNGAIPEWMARPILRQVGDALNYMHSLGIAHRDIKLENILLDKWKNPKLTDFSYSLICLKDPTTGNPAVSKTFCGSVPYMPPEILSKQAYNPQSADIWSLGICVFIMLNDRIPFRFSDISMMLRNQQDKNYQHRRHVNEVLTKECKDLIDQMLEPNPTKRITAANLVKHPWFSLKSKGHG